MTDYEQGRIDATIDVLREWYRFRYQISGRDLVMLDRADIVDAGYGRPLEPVERDKLFPYVLKQDLETEK